MPGRAICDRCRLFARWLAPTVPFCCLRKSSLDAVIMPSPVEWTQSFMAVAFLSKTLCLPGRCVGRHVPHAVARALCTRVGSYRRQLRQRPESWGERQDDTARLEQALTAHREAPSGEPPSSGLRAAAPHPDSVINGRPISTGQGSSSSAALPAPAEATGQRATDKIQSAQGMKSCPLSLYDCSVSLRPRGPKSG
jgi:hypothetical protein